MGDNFIVVVVIMRFCVVIVAVFLGLALAEEPAHYDGYKVYQVIPITVEEARLLNEYKENPAFDFWAAPRALNTPVTVMVTPEAQTDFEENLSLNNLNYSILIENVESSVQAETRRQTMSRAVPRGQVSFNAFMRYDEIVSYLQTVAENYPSRARYEVLGQSYEGRDIPALRITSGGINKPTIFIDAAIHAREWIAPPVALYVIQQLVENEANSELISNVDWVVVPVLNPDGYEFTHTNSRLWRKTRSLNTLCKGVDANRNFDFYWMLIGASNNECSEIYGGPVAFSENETRALRNYLLTHKDQIKLYLTFHSYGQYLLYPWGYTSELPTNNNELYQLGVSVNNAIRSVAGTTYDIGTSTNVLYAAAGGSDDYAKGVAGIELSYTIELPGGGNQGFNPPARRILPIVQETFEGIKVYHNYIENQFA